MGFDELSVAARMRDTIERIAGGVIDRNRPADRIGSVYNFDSVQQIAWVQFPGDTDLTPVRTGPTLIPRLGLANAGVTAATCDVVRVGGKPGDYYIISFLRGAPQVKVSGSWDLGAIKSDGTTTLDTGLSGPWVDKFLTQAQLMNMVRVVGRTLAAASANFTSVTVPAISKQSWMGYNTVPMPVNGTVITGYDGASNATVASGGIPMATNTVLWLDLAIDGGSPTFILTGDSTGTSRVIRPGVVAIAWREATGPINWITRNQDDLCFAMMQNNAGPSFTSTPESTMTWNLADSTLQGGMTATTTAVTLPVDGIYHVEWQIVWTANTAGRRFSRSIVNGGVSYLFGYADTAANAVGGTPLTGSGTRFQVAGTQLGLSVYQNSGITLSIVASSSYMCITKLDQQ